MKKKLLFFTPLMALLLAGCYARIPLPGGGGGSTSGTTSDDPGTDTDTDTDTDDPTPTEKYGTVDNPLTIAQAKALIDGENPTEQTMYVTGVVKSNTAWNTQYSNLNIFITDGSSDFELYACTLPEGFEPAQPAQNELVGKLLVGSGIGKIHNNTYELDKPSKVEKFLPAPAATGIEITCASEVTVGSSIALTAKVTPLGASQEVNWEITEGSSYGTITEGRLQGTAEGSVTVKATAKDVSTVTATKTITVKAAPVGTITDTVDPQVLNIQKETPGKTVYKVFTGTGTSGIAYTANCADETGFIQIKSKDNCSGIVGGSASLKCVSVTFTFHSDTGDTRQVDVYGANAAFTIADMYATSGAPTLLGSIKKSDSSHELTISGNYSYIGLRSNYGAIFLSSISIVWASL